MRPHPHIGLATVTYLFDGEILHRDSLGTLQPIRPGDVNWMTAGRGIAHSERTAPEARASGARLFGIQTWVALPARGRGDRTRLRPSRPRRAADGRRARARRCGSIAGSLYGERSPVPTFSDDVLRRRDARRRARSCRCRPSTRSARSMSSVGAVEVAGDRFERRPAPGLPPGRRDHARRRATPARLLLLGGEPMDGPRHIWWNFVSSRQDRIEQAKADWQAGRFTPVPGRDRVHPAAGVALRAARALVRAAARARSRRRRSHAVLAASVLSHGWPASAWSWALSWSAASA